MSLVYAESFNSRSLRNYTDINGNFAESWNSSRYSNPGFRATDTTGPSASYATSWQLNGSWPTAFVRFNFFPIDFASSQPLDIRWQSGFTHIVRTRHLQNNVDVYLDSSFVGSFTPTDNGWHRIEFVFRAHPSRGFVIFRMSKSESTAYQTQYSVFNRNMSGYNLDRWTFSGFTNVIDFIIDDITIQTPYGPYNNSWIGPGYVSPIPMASDGDTNDFVGSDSDSIDNYQLIDEDTLDTADYVESSTAGDKELYTLSDISLASGRYVAGVISEYHYDATATNGPVPLLKTNGTEYRGDELADGSNLHRNFGIASDYNPATNSYWLENELSDIQVGIENGANTALRIERCRANAVVTLNEPRESIHLSRDHIYGIPGKLGQA